MKRLIVAAFAATTLIATVAFAEAPQAAPGEKSVHARGGTPRYASTEERLRGAPYRRSAAPAHPANAATATEFLPALSFIRDAPAGGAFTLPPR